MGEDHQEGQEKDGGTVKGRTSTSGSYNERSGKLRKMEGDCCHSSKRIIEQLISTISTRWWVLGFIPMSCTMM